MKTYMRFWPAAFLACVLCFSARVAKGDVLESTPQLPPIGGVYTTGVFCRAFTCLDVTLGNFQIVSEQVLGGNMLVSTTDLTTAEVFQSVGGFPGALIGQFSFPGTADFMYFGRTSTQQLGTFTTQLDFAASGTFQGQPFAVMQNPLIATTGITNIHESGPGLFAVNGFLFFNAEVSISGGPFMPEPEVVGTLTTPEPSSVALLITCLAGAGVYAQGRRLRQRIRVVSGPKNPPLV